MSKETKIRITVTVIGWVLAAILQVFGFAYYFGRLAQKVDDLGGRLDRIEQKQITTR